VLLNVTVVGATAAGYVSIRPGDASGPPATSSLNFVPGATTPNAVQVALPTSGPDQGKINITYDAYGAAGPTTDMLIDVVGYTTDSKLASMQSQIDALSAKVAPLVNSVAAVAGGNQSVALGAPQVIRTVSILPPANGTVIVTSSAFLRAGSNNLIGRCSITPGNSIDFSYLQDQNVPAGPDSNSVIAGTRGFTVTKGTLLTVNLVCDAFTGTGATVDDSNLTAIFAPS
jgi:hypothetical protein